MLACRDYQEVTVEKNFGHWCWPCEGTLVSFPLLSSQLFWSFHIPGLDSMCPCSARSFQTVGPGQRSRRMLANGNVLQLCSSQVRSLLT